MLRVLILTVSHAAMLGIGFLVGIYVLPILTAPKGPDAATLEATTKGALYTGHFDRKLKGSDVVHWGEGEVRVLPDKVAHAGRLSPGPDYKLYLAPAFVDTKEGFLAIKDKSRRLGDVKTFNGFIVDVPAGVDVSAYTTAVVWCEAFGQFISAAKYR
jgi:hypothetical protein